jgi:peptidoglycan-N-acetylglucosamine deacetylase
MALRWLPRALLYLAAMAVGVLLAEYVQSHAPLGATTSVVVPSVWAPELAHASAPREEDELAQLAAARPPELERVHSRSYPAGKIIEGSTPHRLILFSFDDGPERRTTPLLLDRLDAVGVKALFFLTASRIAGRNAMEREQATLAREIVARGHLVGSHTVDHLQLPLLDDARAAAQVIGAEQIFKRVLGFRPSLIRPPGGARSPRIDLLLAERSYTTVLWNVGAGDFQVKSAADVLDTFSKVLERRERENGERGGIVLLHDTYSWSVDAFQLIWAELWARNCKLLAQGEELYEIVSDLGLFHRPRDGSPPGTVAAPARLAPAELELRQAKLRVEAAQRCSATDRF